MRIIKYCSISFFRALKICLSVLAQQFSKTLILFYLKVVYIKLYKFEIECITAQCIICLINFGYELEAPFIDIVFLKYLKSILSYRKIMARDYDWENISKIRCTIAQRVIIIRSRNRKIRSCERNYERQVDFPKRVRLGHSRVPSNGWNFIGNKYFLLCSRVPLRQERLVRRYRYRLLGLHQFDETYPRNITFLSMELNTQIHPRGLRFSIAEFFSAFTPTHPLSSFLWQQVSVSRQSA